MATIVLYAGKVNQMPGLVGGIRKSVTDYKSELSALRTKSLQINQSICDLSGVITSIQAASQTQEEKQKSLDKLNQSLEQFAEDVVFIDDEVADLVRQRKDDFYKKYNYLKPVCEMNGWEKFSDSCAKAGEWCKEHWELIGKIFITIIIIVALGIVAALTGGILGVILAGAFWGALSGAVIGGIAGGINNKGNSFIESIINGVFSGAIEGAITGAIFSGVGLAFRAIKNAKFLKSLSKMGNFQKGKVFSEKIGKLIGKFGSKEVHINLRNGARFRADFITRNPFTKKLKIYEVKSSATASFTRGQRNSFAKNMNRLVDTGEFAAKGKNIFGNIVLPKGMAVQVIRPQNLLTFGAKTYISFPVGLFSGLASNIYDR